MNHLHTGRETSLSESLGASVHFAVQLVLGCYPLLLKFPGHLVSLGELVLQLLLFFIHLVLEAWIANCCLLRIREDETSVAGWDLTSYAFAKVTCRLVGGIRPYRADPGWHAGLRGARAGQEARAACWRWCHG